MRPGWGYLCPVLGRCEVMVPLLCLLAFQEAPKTGTQVGGRKGCLEPLCWGNRSRIKGKNLYSRLSESIGPARLRPPPPIPISPTHQVLPLALIPASRPKTRSCSSSLDPQNPGFSKEGRSWCDSKSEAAHPLPIGSAWADLHG